MSLFSSIGKLFKRLFDAILKFIKKFWWVIVLVIIVLAVFFPAVLPAIWGFLSSCWTAVSGWLGTAFSTIFSWAGSAWTAVQGWLSSASFGEVLKLAAGAAIILNPEGVGEAVGDVVGGVGEAIGSVVKAIPSTVWWIAGGLLAWKLFFTGDSDEEERVVVVEQRGSTEWQPQSATQTGQTYEQPRSQAPTGDPTYISSVQASRM